MVEAVKLAAETASTDLISVISTSAPLAIGLMVGVVGIRIVMRIFKSGAK